MSYPADLGRFQARLVALVAITLAWAAAPEARAATRCSMTLQDRAWVNNALNAADFMAEERLRLPPYRHPTVIVFNERCRFQKREGSNRWSSEPHSGRIRAGKANLPVGLVAYQDDDPESGERFLVMALPSIWEAAKAARPRDPGLIAVFLHEFAHARQSPAVRSHFQHADSLYGDQKPDNDDSLQERFKDDPAYLAVWEKETSLLYQAAAEPDDTKARELAAEALRLMEARQKRWFVGADAMWKFYDDVYLSMEGLGQWVAYAWLSDAKGAAMTGEAAREKMRGRQRQWSQEEGLGLFLVIDRFVPDWPQRLHAAQPAMGIDLLRMATTAVSPPGRATPALPEGM